MKKFILSLTMFFACVSVMAQKHLTFKGIPIEGSMTEFCQKLTSKGFVSLGREDNVSLFAGNFTGRKSTVGIISSDNGKDVYGVMVFFDSCSEWNTLVDTYGYYKNLYTRKYGEPAISREEINSDSDDNTILMIGLSEGKNVYASLWKVEGGEIEIDIKKGGVAEGRVVICYRDAQNLNAKIEKDLDEI